MALAGVMTASERQITENAAAHNRASGPCARSLLSSMCLSISCPPYDGGLPFVLPTLTDRGAQTITQRIAVNGVVTAPKFHSREPHLTKKLDAEPLAARDLDGPSSSTAHRPSARWLHSQNASLPAHG